MLLFLLSLDPPKMQIDKTILWLGLKRRIPKLIDYRCIGRLKTVLFILSL